MSHQSYRYTLVATMKKSYPANKACLYRLNFCIPLVVLLCATFFAYPGVFNYDTTMIYLEAASHRGNTLWSLPLEQFLTVCMMSGLRNYGSIFLASQATLALGSLAILTACRGSVLKHTLFSTILLLCPAFSVFLIRINREGPFAGCLMLAFGAALLWRQSEHRLQKNFCFGTCLLALTGASIIRFDGVVAGVPLVLLLVHSASWRGRVLKALTITLFFVALIFTVHKLARVVYGKSSGFLTSHGAMHLDITALSVKKGRMLYSPQIQEQCQDSLEPAIKNYNENLESPDRFWWSHKPCRVYGKLLQTNWWDIVREYPISWFTHRLERGALQLGLLRRGSPGSFITHEINTRTGQVNSVLPREEKKFREKILYPIRTDGFNAHSGLIAFEQTVRSLQEKFYFRGYFYLLLHFFSMAMCIKKQRASIWLFLSLSGCCHLVAMVFLSPIASHRYISWFALSGWISFWGNILAAYSTKTGLYEKKNLKP